MEKKIRLDKFLAEMKRGSRRQIKEIAKKGGIFVNGEAETRTERKIDPSSDLVSIDGIPVVYRAFEYYMLNKPQGVVSATEDKLHRTVIDLLGEETRRDLFPVGRLDIDTEGLLILTNDGELAHRLLSPKKHVDKQYYAEIYGRLPTDSAARMESGMVLEDGTQLQPGKLELLASGSDGNLSQVLLTIQEGKFHQVKRMFEALGCHVEYLKRLSMGSLKLDETLAPGAYRPLTEEELKEIRWWK